MITEIMQQVRTFTDRLPKMVLNLLLGLMPPDFQKVMSLTDSQTSILDEDLEKLIDGIGARDYEAVGALVEKYNVNPDSRPGKILLRLMGEPEEISADEMSAIEAGLADVKNGRVMSHEEFEARMSE